MLSSRPPPALGITAESSVPAGLRLGPVPGNFKLGKYLSDRREPGPKKKVLLPHLGGKRRGRPRSPDGKGAEGEQTPSWGGVGGTARKKPYFTSLDPPVEGERQGRVWVSEASGLGDLLVLTPFRCLDLRRELALGTHTHTCKQAQIYWRALLFLLHPEWLLTLSRTPPSLLLSLPK